jgi:hypothetical protein
MSLVKVSGNASGTGTLTIAAPNTNSDYTLTLPDAAGEMYNQGNILGTVSQSGGVPTGAIIESGSNANGEYVKWADGTMMCFSPDLVGNGTWTVAGSQYYQSLAAWTHPATFVGQVFGFCFDINSVNVFGGFNDSDGGLSRLFANVNTFGTRTARATAIGRWF